VLLLCVVLAVGCRTAAPADESGTGEGLGVQTGRLEFVEGLLEARTENAGTLSEYTYFVLTDRPGRDGVILFREESGKSWGFDEYVGSRVRVACEWGTGSIGWRNTRQRGLLVHSIELVE
jgi:hypothetical protein